MTDIVDDFLQRLAAMAPELSPTVPVQLEAELRQHWGGTEPYIAKRAHVRRDAQQRLVQGLREARPLREILDATGVSRRTGYRMLSRR